MTREEKQKAIDALKISAPVIAVTQEEFMDYVQTVNKIMDCIEQEPCEDAISRQAAIDAINKIHPVDTDYDCTLYDKIDVMYVLKDLPPVNPQNCDKCEVGNPCLYCKHEFEERSNKE